MREKERLREREREASQRTTIAVRRSRAAGAADMWVHSTVVCLLALMWRRSRGTKWFNNFLMRILKRVKSFLR